MKNLFKILFLTLLIFPVLSVSLCLSDLNRRSLEYDEIWTYLNFANLPVHRIFSSLDCPNNHPFHTLCCKLMLVGQKDIRLARIPAVAGGLALLAVFAFFLYRKGNVRTCVIGTALLGCSAPYLRYLSTARGYSLQMLFVLLFILALFYRPGPDRKTCLFRILLLLVPAVLTCLTITSGLLFVVSAVAAYVLSQWQEKKREYRPLADTGMVWAALLFAVFVYGWYGYNRSDIVSGQVFGISFWRDPAAFLRALWHQHLLHGHILSFLVPSVLLLAVPKYRSFSIFALSFAFFSYLSAFVVCLGPARVYYPLLPILIAAASFFADHLLEKFVSREFLRWSIVVPVCCLSFVSGRHLLPDYYDVDPKDYAEQIRKGYPLEFPVFFPTAAVSFRALFPKLVNVYFDRPPKYLALYGCNGTLYAENMSSGASFSYDVSKQIVSSQQVCSRIVKELCPLYPLTTETTYPDHGLIIGMCSGEYGFPGDSGWLMINYPLSLRLCRMYVRSVSEMTKQECLTVMRANHNRIQFFFLEKPAEPEIGK